MLRQKVTVRVPATTANMGPGYDCIGLAVDLWNELTVERASKFSMHIEGEGAEAIPRTKENFVVKGLELAFAKAGKPVPELAYFCKNGIPFGSGLGSSSAGIVSGLLAGAVLAGLEMDVTGVEEMLQMAATLEGHIDNLSPCIYGGMQLGIHTGHKDDKGRWATTRINVPAGLQCLVFTPSTPMNTAEARAMLKDHISRADAVFNLGRLGLLIHAFESNDLDKLRLACQDAMHQPVRGSANVMPALYPIIDAAIAAGASGAFLSGAGSSIMALVKGVRGDRHVQSRDERWDAQVSAAMTATAARLGVEGKLRYSEPTVTGAYVVSIQEAPTRLFGPPMKYHSTRDATGRKCSFEAVVMEGLAPDGGLFVPERIPNVDRETLSNWRKLSFPELSAAVMGMYISPDEISPSILRSLVDRSYATFTSSHVTPLVDFSDDGTAYLLEQFHGPTCAFKDVALQFVGNLFEFFLQRRNADSPGDGPHRITVLGATSGDTGSAAIQGLRGKEDVDVFILHPHKRVAAVQEAQMTSVLDANVHNVAVNATFDDCQTIVKDLFNDKEFRAKHSLAAVNSINWARILAQIVYYFYGYFRWLDADDSRKLGDAVSFVVPTGNFGNSLAGFYAREMGLPIDRLVVATNSNDILHRFLSKSDYTARPVAPSQAPAMDIVIPSNFERFLFWLFGNDPVKLTAVMKDIKTNGKFELGADKAALMDTINNIFQSGSATDAQIQAAIDKYVAERRYILCPHTAAGVHTLDQVRQPGHSYICMATAHPGKFMDVTQFGQMEPQLPPQLEGLLDRPRRCLRAPNDKDAIKAILDQRSTSGEAGQAARAVSVSPSPLPAPAPATSWLPIVAAFGLGAALAIAAQKRL